MDHAASQTGEIFINNGLMIDKTYNYPVDLSCIVLKIFVFLLTKIISVIDIFYTQPYNYPRFFFFHGFFLIFGGTLSYYHQRDARRGANATSQAKSSGKGIITRG